MSELKALSQKIVEICQAAGEEILAVYHDEAGFNVDLKADDSPVTRADIAANRVIVNMLNELTPDIPVLTEESSVQPFEERQHWPRYWIVDPLDGTKEFINRADEFTVNIALVEKHQAVMGVVYVPVSGVTYVGHDEGAVKIQNGVEEIIRCRALKSVSDVIEVVASKRHLSPETEQFIAAMKNNHGDVLTTSIGSSLKFCLVAEGKADVYPRFAPTSEWDTAAAQAVVEAAGGLVLKKDLSPLDYNTKENILNPHFFAVADPNVDWNSVMQQCQ